MNYDRSMLNIVQNQKIQIQKYNQEYLIACSGKVLDAGSISPDMINK